MIAGDIVKIVCVVSVEYLFWINLKSIEFLESSERYCDVGFILN